MHPTGTSSNASLDYRDSFIRCPDGSICCGYDNTACCEQRKGHAEIDYRNFATIPSTSAELSTYYEGVKPITLPISSSPSAVSTTSTALASPSLIISTLTLGTGLQTALPTSNSKPGSDTLSISAKVGIAVGITVAVILIATLNIWLWRRQRKPPHELHQSTDETQRVPFHGMAATTRVVGSEVARELEGNRRIEEREGNPSMELEGNVRRV